MRKDQVNFRLDAECKAKINAIAKKAKIAHAEVVSRAMSVYEQDLEKYIKFIKALDTNLTLIESFADLEKRVQALEKINK